MTLDDQYRERFNNALQPAAQALERQLQAYFSQVPRIDRISARAKSADRFLAKAAKINKDGTRKYKYPLTEIQDQIGARIITFYRSDVAMIADQVERYYTPIESREHSPESEWEFGYFGKHYIFLLPKDVATEHLDQTLLPKFFELQIKTLFQHAWSEGNHDLGYKPEGGDLTSEQKRKLAFTSAQAWGADFVFDELKSERKIG